MESNKSLTQWMQRQLDRREWTQADFARQLDVGTAVVSRWMTGKRVPSPRYCDLIADALGVDVDTVLELAGHRPKIDGIDPESPRAILQGKIDRIDWTVPGRFETIDTLVEFWRTEDLKRRRKDKQ